MTAHQFAVAAGTDVKWIFNSASILRRRLHYTVSQSRWWGLVRLLNETLHLPLHLAAEAATASLASGSADGVVTVGADQSHSASMVVDLARYQSVFLGNLSMALVLETPRRRGRSPRPNSGNRALATAERYGIDLGLARAALARSPAQRLAMLDANSAFLREARRRRA
ncbi:MAG: hypothetical protein ABIS15_06890 [Gemmatimonadaceae bacterium]